MPTRSVHSTQPSLDRLPPALALGLLAMFVGPAVSGPAAAQGLAESVDVGYVLVPVSVRSRAGFVDDLERDELRLTVDGRPVEIDAFERGAEVPISLVLLQDLSGSMAMGGRLATSRALVECFLTRARPADRFALAGFAGRRVEVEVPFPGDPGAIREAVERWRPYGLTALHDAVARLPEITAAGRQPRAVAVLLTDGAENASRLDPATARRAVRQAGLAVYVVGLLAPAGERPARPGREAELLRELAAETGGRYLQLAGDQSAAGVCESIERELRSRYVLGFPLADGGAARYRRLRVEVLRPGLRYAYRRGYVGRVPAGAPTPAGR